MSEHEADHDESDKKMMAAEAAVAALYANRKADKEYSDKVAALKVAKGQKDEGRKQPTNPFKVDVDTTGFENDPDVKKMVEELGLLGSRETLTPGQKPVATILPADSVNALDAAASPLYHRMVGSHYGWFRSGQMPTLLPRNYLVHYRRLLQETS